jgi:hypothetical protein
LHFLARNRPGEQPYDEIASGEFGKSLTKTFAGASLDAVAIHRTRQDALAHDQPEPGVA